MKTVSILSAVVLSVWAAGCGAAVEQDDAEGTSEALQTQAPTSLVVEGHANALPIRARTELDLTKEIPTLEKATQEEEAPTRARLPLDLTPERVPTRARTLVDFGTE